MGTVGVYIRKDLVKPLDRYCTKKHILQGKLINELIKRELIEEGFIHD